jgi:hypothetical protein
MVPVTLKFAEDMVLRARSVMPLEDTAPKIKAKATMKVTMTVMRDV